MWREALEECGGPDNADSLWPVLANGFRDLAARLKIQARRRGENPETPPCVRSARSFAAARSGRERALLTCCRVSARVSALSVRVSVLQDETLAQYAKRMDELALITKAVQRRRQSEFAERAREIRQRHVAQSDRLLRCCRLIEALESRAFAGGPLVREEAALRQRLRALQGLLQGGGGALSRRAEAVAAAAHALAEADGGAAAAGGRFQGEGLDARGLEKLMQALQQQTAAVQKLQEVARRDEMDARVIEQWEAQHLPQAGGAGGGAGLLTVGSLASGSGGAGALGGGAGDAMAGVEGGGMLPGAGSMRGAFWGRGAGGGAYAYA